MHNVLKDLRNQLKNSNKFNQSFINPALTKLQQTQRAKERKEGRETNGSLRKERNTCFATMVPLHQTGIWTLAHRTHEDWVSGFRCWSALFRRTRDNGRTRVCVVYLAFNPIVKTSNNFIIYNLLTGSLAVFMIREMSFL